MDATPEEREKANQTAELCHKKLLEIMELQADIDALLRDKHPTPFGSARFTSASLEELQRLVLMTSIQFVLFEPGDWVPGNKDFGAAADKLLKIVSRQLKKLAGKPND